MQHLSVGSLYNELTVFTSFGGQVSHIQAFVKSVRECEPSRNEAISLTYEAFAGAVAAELDTFIASLRELDSAARDFAAGVPG